MESQEKKGVGSAHRNFLHVLFIGELIIQLKYLFFALFWFLIILHDSSTRAPVVTTYAALDAITIKALIDDELANNAAKVSKQLICEPQNYTIYERFQDIEHALDGDEMILDIWKNWGTRTDVQFRLKINKTKKEIEDQQVDDEEDDRMSTKSKVIKTFFYN